MAMRVTLTAEIIAEEMLPHTRYTARMLAHLTHCSETAIRPILKIGVAKKVLQIFSSQRGFVFARIEAEVPQTAEQRLAPKTHFESIQGYDAKMKSFRDLCMAVRPASPPGLVVRYGVVAD